MRSQTTQSYSHVSLDDTIERAELPKVKKQSQWVDVYELASMLKCSITTANKILRRRARAVLVIPGRKRKRVIPRSEALAMGRYIPLPPYSGNPNFGDQEFQREAALQRWKKRR